MCLIYDSFPDETAARRFASYIAESCGLETWTYLDIAEALAHDPFPFPLFPPVVHVERPARRHRRRIVNVEAERRLERAVVPFGGEFVGT